MASQSIIVPQISSFPGHEGKARLILRWLSKREIIAPLASTCGRGPGGMAYAIAPGARRIVEHPELLPFGQAINGLEIVYCP